MTPSERYLQLLERVSTLAKEAGRNPQEIAVIAVSKMHPLESILAVYGVGCRQFGESRIQEALPKMESAPKDILWHLIGSLQKNKVNKAVGKFALIHSVDSLELAQKISQSSQAMQVTTAILLEVNASGESSKHGLSPEAWKAAFDAVQRLPNMEVQGLMTMAPLTKDESVVRKTFSNLRQLKDELTPYAANKAAFKHLSMGMSHDYPLAIQEGATLLRIGTEIFSS